MGACSRAANWVLPLRFRDLLRVRSAGCGYLSKAGKAGSTPAILGDARARAGSSPAGTFPEGIDKGRAPRLGGRNRGEQLRQSGFP